MSYDVAVLADSTSNTGSRLTTIQATFPRPFLAEINTHRMFSRNSASSRAIPTEKQIERILEDPYLPQFNARVKGMGVGEPLTSDDQAKAEQAWLGARDAAAIAAGALLDVDKSRANRLLEPFLWHTAIISATDWDNFLALRQPADGPVPNLNFPAQPEVQIVSRMIADALAESTPVLLGEGEWHLPLVTVDERTEHPIEYLKDISAGRLARVSYDTHENFEEPAVSALRTAGLKTNGHLSPLEHVARPFTTYEILGVAGAKVAVQCAHHLDSQAREQMMRQAEYRNNFRGFVQYRAEVPFEHNYQQVINQEVEVV